MAEQRAKAPAKRPARKRQAKPKPAKSNLEAVREFVESLRREQQLDTHGEALAALAERLAGLLDIGDPIMMTASWARELRQTLDALVPPEVVDDDDDDWTIGAG